MSWKESKVRLLPPPQALNPQDRKPDIQDLFLLASQATAYRNSISDTSSSGVTLPLHPIKVEQNQVIANEVTSADSAMMPPPPVPPPRPPASPGVSSTTTSLESDQCHPLVQGSNQPLLGKNLKKDYTVVKKEHFLFSVTSKLSLMTSFETIPNSVLSLLENKTYFDFRFRNCARKIQR